MFGKPFWITIATGVFGLAFTWFLTRTQTVKEFEQKFELWKAEFIANYRSEPETVRVCLSLEDSLAIAKGRPFYKTRWLPSKKPMGLSWEDSANIAQRFFDLSADGRDSLLRQLMSTRASDPFVHADSIVNESGDTIKTKSTVFLWFNPLAESPFGHFQYLTEVIYPRSGSSFVENKQENDFFEGIYLNIAARSPLKEWKLEGDVGLSLRVNIGGGRQIVPSVRYDTGNTAWGRVELNQKLF